MSTSLSLENILETRWGKLPAECQGIFLNPSFEKEIANVATYYKINQAQYDQLKNEVTLVLFLFEPITALSQNIEHELKISNNIAVAITSEIELMLLYTASDFLYKIARDTDFVGMRNNGIKQEWGSLTKATPSPIDAFKEAVRKNEPAPTQPIRQQTSTQQDQTGPRPLTREEVLKAITPVRTMQKDTRSIADTPN